MMRFTPSPGVLNPEKSRCMDAVQKKTQVASPVCFKIHSLNIIVCPNEGLYFSIYGSLFIDGSNGLTEGAEAGCYLASGSRDQTVRIWSTARGKGAVDATGF